MAEEVNALGAAKFGSGLYLKDIPKDGVKIRILTRDPMVYVDTFGNTKYVFAVYNLDEDMVQLLDKGPGFPSEFQKIDADQDFGADIRKIDLKVSSNGKSGKDIRYDIKPVGAPHDPVFTEEQIKTIYSQGFDLAEKVKKNAPNALRLSEINAGAKVKPNSVEPSEEGQDVVIEDIPDDINLDDIPF